MNLTVIFINIFALACLGFAFIKDRKKTKQALIVALKSFFRILPSIFMIIIIIGLLLGFMPQSTISNVMGVKSGFIGILFIAVLGTILFIPAIIAFPLAASLLRNGASITGIAVFITTLTMIGIVSLPLEIKEMGLKIALLRNGLSFIIAIIVGLIMGIIL